MAYPRRYERIRIACQTKVLFDNQDVMALTEDLSLNGVSLSTDLRLPIGKRASISLNIPSAICVSPLIFYAEVTREKEHGLAFEFKSIDPETFSCLRAAISNKKKIEAYPL